MRIEKNKRSAEVKRQRREAKQKKKMEEVEEASKKKKDDDPFLGLKNVKSGRVEKQKVEKTIKVVAMQKTAAEEEDDNDGDEKLWGKYDDFCQGHEEEEEKGLRG